MKQNLGNHMFTAVEELYMLNRVLLLNGPASCAGWRGCTKVPGRRETRINRAKESVGADLKPVIYPCPGRVAVKGNETEPTSVEKGGMRCG